MVEMLERRQDIAAVEIGISPRAGGDEALSLVRAAGIELPVIVCVPLDRAREDWLFDLPTAGASAVCLSAPYGALPGRDAKPISGRLYGRGLFPLILSAVQRMHRLPIPLIAGAGVFSLADGQALLDAGAWAVQLDLVLWGIKENP